MNFRYFRFICEWQIKVREKQSSVPEASDIACALYIVYVEINDFFTFSYYNMGTKHYHAGEHLRFS